MTSSFAPLREKRKRLVSREGAKEKGRYEPRGNIAECSENVLQLVGHNLS